MWRGHWQRARPSQEWGAGGLHVFCVQEPRPRGQSFTYSTSLAAQKLHINLMTLIWLCPMISTNYSKFKLQLDLPFFYICFFFFLLQLDTVFPPFNFPSHEEPSSEMFDIKGKFTYTPVVNNIFMCVCVCVRVCVFW